MSRTAATQPSKPPPRHASCSFIPSPVEIASFPTIRVTRSIDAPCHHDVPWLKVRRGPPGAVWSDDSGKAGSCEDASRDGGAPKYRRSTAIQPDPSIRVGKAAKYLYRSKLHRIR